jgi:aminomethyltransferase
MSLKKTPLYDSHVNLGARLVDFAGWMMPVQYSGLKEEHLACRNSGGLFDVSHMGEIWVRGPQSLETLQWLTTNDVSKLSPGQAHYSLLPNDQGGLVDDIIVYCLEVNKNYLVCVNASNKDKDYKWMTDHNKGAEITDESDLWGQVAVQGPKVFELLKDIFNEDFSNRKAFTFVETLWKSHRALIAFTGYTGERGCEIFVEKEGVVSLWSQLIEKGRPRGILPCGLGARDTLRTEMKYSLYGNEIDETTNPYAAGLGWVIKLSAKDFIGKTVILNQKEKGLPWTLVGFKMKERGIPRHGYETFSLQGEKMGLVTSGTHSPSLDEPIGIGYVDPQLSKPGSEFDVDIRGRKVRAVTVETPFVKSRQIS